MSAARARHIGAIVCVCLVTVAACSTDDGGVSVASIGASTTIAEATTVAPTTTVAATEPPTTMPATTGAPATTATTATTTTVADTEPTPITAGPTTTTPGITVGFDPACVETNGGGPVVDPGLDNELLSLGQLGYTPAIVVHLPLGHGEDDDSVGPANARVSRIPGGFLFGIRAGSYGSFDGSVYGVVNTDGTVRWVRCFDEQLSGPIVEDAFFGPSVALVSTTSFDAGTMSTQWYGLSLADGSITADLQALAEAAGFSADDIGRLIAQTSQEVVLGSWDDRPIDESVDRLLRVDLHTFEFTAVPYPPGSGGSSTGSLYLVNGDDDVLMTTTQPSGGGPSIPAAVLVDDGWSTGRAVLDAAQPVTVVFDESDGPGTLYAYDSLGRTIWERPDIGTNGGEGFRSAASGDVAVVSGCAPGGEPVDPCTDEGALWGIDISTGETLWQLDGARGVGVVGDGVAIITTAIDRGPTDAPQIVSWLMIDVRTGEQIEGQEWPEPYNFGTECCGGDEVDHTELLGGAVATVHGTLAYLWLPLELTPRIPIEVTIP